MTPADSPEWKATRADLDVDARAEYDRLDAVRREEMTSRERGLIILAFVCLFGPLVVLVLIVATTNSWVNETAAVVLNLVCVVSPALFLALAVTALVILVRRRRQARDAMAGLLRDHAPRPTPSRNSQDPSGTGPANYRRFPVTGTYNPELYYERGGRETARGMAASGIDDYETYRTNMD